MGDVIREFEHLEKLAIRASDFSNDCAGKPDAAMSCPSGLEGAGRKRASAMM